MLFVNNNCGKGNRTGTSDTFVSKYMVNVNAYHKEGFYFMILSERGHHVHQTNGRFVYVGLNVDGSHKYGAACIFYCINQDTQLKQIVQTNFSRNKVEIVIRFKTSFQTNRPRARSATGINQLR